LRFNAERPIRNRARAATSQLFLKTPVPPAGIHVVVKANSPTLPPIPAKTGPGRKRSGPVPAWGLKLGGFLTTLGVFVSSFGYAGTHLYVTNAPLQPATVAAVATTGTTAATSAAAATASPSTATSTTTTLTRAVQTTTRPAVTVTTKS
jgi:hypothetical protein